MGKYKFVQSPQFVETLTCGMYHEANTYQVVEIADNKTVYSVEEMSSIMFRWLCLCKCPPANRPYESRIYNSYGSLIGQVDRPCMCSVLCIWRPEATVKDPIDSLIGSVYNPWPRYAWCNLKVSVMTDQGVPEYHISICICNFHVMCECCIGPCSETDITITPGDGIDNANMPVSIKKVWSGCGKEWFSSADEYEFDVPENWNDIQWAKFLTALQMFDMLFFEQCLSCFPFPDWGKCCFPC